MISVRSACEHGVPLVLLPLFAEHAFTAARCDALGMARVLDARTVTLEAVREVLEDPRYRAQAGQVRDELAAMPGPDYALALLERLAAEQWPLLTA